MYIIHMGEDNDFKILFYAFGLALSYFLYLRAFLLPFKYNLTPVFNRLLSFVWKEHTSPDPSFLINLLKEEDLSKYSKETLKAMIETKYSMSERELFEFFGFPSAEQLKRISKNKSLTWDYILSWEFDSKVKAGSVKIDPPKNITNDYLALNELRFGIFRIIRAFFLVLSFPLTIFCGAWILSHFSMKESQSDFAYFTDIIILNPFRIFLSLQLLIALFLSYFAYNFETAPSYLKYSCSCGEKVKAGKIFLSKCPKCSDRFYRPFLGFVGNLLSCCPLTWVLAFLGAIFYFLAFKTDFLK